VFEEKPLQLGKLAKGDKTGPSFARRAIVYFGQFFI
jgi:hypothetical protein